MSDFFGPKESQALRERLGEQDLGKLSEQEEHSIRERMAATDKLFLDQVKAKYKLEVQFYEKRSTIEPFAGVMSFLLNGNRLHGGGDSKVYLCPVNNCYGVIDPTDCQVTDLDADAITPDLSKIPLKVVCPKCQKISLSVDLWGERLLKLNTQGWARALYDNFRYLGSSADVRLIFHHADLHAHTQSEMNRGANGNIIIEARRRRQKAIYTLKRILTDTAHGADLYGRFLAFVREG
jgi:hypothetical protein